MRDLRKMGRHHFHFVGRQSHRAFSATTATAPRRRQATLTPTELDTLTTLLPRLVSSGEQSAFLRLLSTAFHLSPTPALPIPAIISHLSASTSLAPAMSLLCCLHHHPLRPSPIPFAHPLVSSFFSLRRPLHAAKVFSFLCRPESHHRPDADLFRSALLGFCGCGLPLNALKVVKEMARDGIMVDDDAREKLFVALLMEARVDEARQVDAVLRSTVGKQEGDGNERFGELVEVVDRLVAEWE